MSGLRRLLWSLLGLALLAWLVHFNREPVTLRLWPDVSLALRLDVLLLAVALVVLAVVLPWWMRAARPRGHDPRSLLPLILPARVRRALTRGYAEGALDEASRAVGEALARTPNNLGLHFWAIRIDLDLGRFDQARARLIELLPRLPEAALTIRWSSLFESAGEQDLWIRNVLERIRDGHVVRRSTFRELVRLLDAAGRYSDGLDVLRRLRETDPPTPEEEEDLLRAEMSMRIRLAQQLREEGRGDEALREVQWVRERATGWRSPYRVGFEVLSGLGRDDEALAWLLEGYRNTGDPDLLMRAYRHQLRTKDPLSLLEDWDERLGDLADDGWLLLTSGWIALRHGLVEEGGRRLRRIEPTSEAAAHAAYLRAIFEAERKHVQEALAAAVEAGRAWYELPFVWRCSRCEAFEARAPFICPHCGEWESYQLMRPLGLQEPAARGMVATRPGK